MRELQLKFEKVLLGLIPEDALTEDELIELQNMLMDAICRKKNGDAIVLPQVIQ